MAVHKRSHDAVERLRLVDGARRVAQIKRLWGRRTGHNTAQRILLVNKGFRDTSPTRHQLSALDARFSKPKLLNISNVTTPYCHNVT